MSASSTNLDVLIRKLRKKLRQIENLEILHRPLTHEEITKVNSKDDIRAMLQDVLEEQLEDEEQVTEEALSQNQKPSGEISRGVGDGKGSATELSCHDRSDQGTDQGNKQKTCDASGNISTEDTQTHQQGKGDVKKHKTKDKQKTKDKNVKARLSESYCRLSCFEGHSDLVTALVVVGDRVVTASRDTTLKCWDIPAGKEIHNYGGHTGAVTSLLVLYDAKDVTLPDNDKLLVSGSLDSTFKLWALNSGQLLRSVYTYNPVVRIAYCAQVARLITGSDGGKLEMWNLASGENMFSSRVHTAAVTGLKVSGKTVYSCASDGIIRVHQVAEDNQLTCIFVSENLKTSTGDPVITRSIRCLDICSDLLLFGDDSRNIKTLDWKKGLVSKLANHTDNFTFTDALCCHGDLLLSSSYDLDHAVGLINVRSSKTLEYLATFDHMGTERIVCLDFGYLSADRLFVVSGGMELLLWEVLPLCPDSKSPNEDTTEKEEEEIFKLNFIPALAEQCVDSDTESSDVDSDDDDIRQWSRQYEKLTSHDSSTGWTSWCHVL